MAHHAQAYPAGLLIADHVGAAATQFQVHLTTTRLIAVIVLPQVISQEALLLVQTNML